MANTVNIKFVGTIADASIDEVLPIAVYQKGVDAQILYVHKGDTVSLNENQYNAILSLIGKGVNVVESYETDMLLAGTADVYNAASTPNDQVATVTHTIGNTNYEVELSNANYEVVNVTNTSFQVQLIPGKTSAGADILYVVKSL